MYQLIRFIESMFEEYQFEIIDKTLLIRMQYAVDSFIDQNYPNIKNIKPNKYVTLSCDAREGRVNVDINPMFEKELEIHYIEKLI